MPISTTQNKPLTMKDMLATDDLCHRKLKTSFIIQGYHIEMRRGIQQGVASASRLFIAALSNTKLT
ncbi:hypothetical protein KIN20_024471 [Parelaphostrongylus tenuis]|uniref:Uncharacterized protein n=1 Tax=Parelaphostrongylus tenuis TaxID=148309 RepID=A0AAD5MTK4_PARTN|nr:hypothetical protein KIN20_024471 [Parelaphostrongylus tenuis]